MKINSRIPKWSNMTSLHRNPHSFSRFLFSLCFCSLLLPSSFSIQPCYAAEESAPANKALPDAPEGQAPIGLAAALQAVMAYHPAVKGKQAEVNSQGYALDSAKAARFPSLSAQANNLDDQYEQGTLRLQQPLWAFGKIDTEIKHAKASYHSEQFGLLDIRRQLIENTAVIYAQIEGIQKRTAVARLNIEEHEQLYQQIKRRQAGHLASEADMHLAYSRFIQARVQLVSLQGNLQVALTDLHALTQVAVAVDQPIDKRFTSLPSLAQVEALALKNSARLRYKQKQLEVVLLDVKREKVAALPTVYYRMDHEFLDNPGNGERTSNGFVLEGNLEGFGFSALGRAKAATARQVAAQEDLNVTRNEVRSRVNNLMSNRSVQQLLIKSQREVVTVVESTMASFLRQYESGRKSWLDVLNTQRELTELRLGLAKIENDWLILSLRIAALTGGLDQLAGIKTL